VGRRGLQRASPREQLRAARFVKGAGQRGPGRSRVVRRAAACAAGLAAAAAASLAAPLAAPVGAVAAGAIAGAPAAISSAWDAGRWMQAAETGRAFDPPRIAAATARRAARTARADVGRPPGPSQEMDGACALELLKQSCKTTRAPAIAAFAVYIAI
jgi:hypothetical protein